MNKSMAIPDGYEFTGVNFDSKRVIFHFEKVESDTEKMCNALSEKDKESILALLPTETSEWADFCVSFDQDSNYLDPDYVNQLRQFCLNYLCEGHLHDL